MRARRTVATVYTALAVLFATSLGADSLNILWDDTHDTDGDELAGPSPNYSEFAAIALALGHSITERDAPGDLTDLSGFDLLMIVDAEVPFSAAEIAAIQGFVADGGELLVLGENPAAFDRSSHNDLLSPWGVSFTTLAVPFSDFLNDADVTDPIGFSPIFFASFGELAVTGAGAQVLGTTFFGPGFASAAGGSVLVFSDSNFMDDTRISPGDNEEQLVVALLDYFSSLAGDGLLEITIDIVPDDDSNPVNPRRRGVLTVAILTTSVAAGDSQDFDAWDVDSLSLKLGPGEAEIVHAQGHAEDPDGDGDLDMVVHFPVPEIGIDCATTELVLTGETLNGEPFTGVDSVVPVGCLP